MNAQMFKYIVNGIIATVVHFSIFSINIELFSIRPISLANFIASFFGMTSSFIGNRLFVFNNYAPILQQFYKFWLLYFAIAVLHTVTLFLWSDIMNFNYKTGFLLATIMQFLLSYSGNKVLVFK